MSRMKKVGLSFLIIAVLATVGFTTMKALEFPFHYKKKITHYTKERLAKPLLMNNDKAKEEVLRKENKVRDVQLMAKLKSKSQQQTDSGQRLVKSKFKIKWYKLFYMKGLGQ